MTATKEETTVTIGDGVQVSGYGEIIEPSMQIAEFDAESVVSNHIFEYRLNCQEGKVFLGDSKKRVISEENESENHEFLFTLVTFQKITLPAGYAILSPKYAKTREWGQVIGIDKDGLIFSSFVKTYAFGSFKLLIDGFVHDVQTKKETGSLAGKLVKLDFGKKIKGTEGDYYMPSVAFVKEQSSFLDRAKELDALKKQGAFSFPTPSLIKV